MKYLIEARYDWGKYPCPGLLTIFKQEVEDWEKVELILDGFRNFPRNLEITITFGG